MKGDDLFTTTGGFATLGPELTEVKALIEARLLGWARECGADSMLFPPLMSVADLAALDYFDNFPQLLLLAAPIDLDRGPSSLPGPAAGGETDTVANRSGGTGLVDDGTVANGRLGPSRYALPSAACYNVYLDLRDRFLPETRYVTTVATCFRNEKEYEGLRRLHGFSMREIVCVGPRDAVMAHLTAFKPRIVALGRELGLALDICAATDPFFQPDSGRAVLQKLFPVKEEFVHGGSLAIASVNFHRNFFGERCRIRTADDEWAYSGCVAFGLERWLAALLEAHDGTVEPVLAALRPTKVEGDALR
jgi:hypothetical protein